MHCRKHCGGRTGKPEDRSGPADARGHCRTGGAVRRKGSMKRIDDQRIATAEEADQVMAQINTREARKAKITAVAESKIATIKSQLVKDLARYDEDLQPLYERMKTFINANPGLFQRPKKRKTPAGEYGLQAATELIISNEEDLIAWLKKEELTDCIKVTEAPIKKEVTKLLKNKQQVPGCTLKTGDTAVIKPDPDTIRYAKEID
ncbi:hypothetical protein EGM51_10750 [Verrucomicrobia bacterium S94]|nr:hypothetical protein EGM51_10750 [Verrucomicrobia bacterium S94]